VSSLIVLGIVGIWILVLVPMWLNRHDADSASRSMDTFSTAMRVLSRRDQSQGRFSRRFGRAARADSTADGQYLVMPRDDWGVTVDNQTDLSTARRRLRVPLHLPSRRQSYATSGRAQLIARRRRIAVGFAVLVIGLALSAEFLHTSWWFELGAGLALAGYLIHLRTEAIRTSEMRRRSLARAARAAAPYAARTLDGRTAGGERYYAARVRHDDADVTPLAAETVAGSVTGSPSGTEDGSRWEPIAVPLPTYVSKPVVSRPATAAPRADVESGPIIDLTQPGKWVDSQVDVRHLLLDDEVPEADELDVILARRRAVNH
jgi:type II secretory pathway pseudopilin PulG